jgi:hypothetical protein
MMITEKSDMCNASGVENEAVKCEAKHTQVCKYAQLHHAPCTRMDMKRQSR